LRTRRSNTYTDSHTDINTETYAYTKGAANSPSPPNAAVTFSQVNGDW